MFYNETPSASGQTLTFDVNPQPGDVIQFVSPVTNISTEAYAAVFSTGESFPIMYGGEELVQAYLLYSGQTYLAVFTGNGLEITAQQAADAEGNTVNTAPYVINTFLDPAYSGLLTEQMQALASLVGDGTKLTGNFTVPVTMSTGLSVTGDVSVSSGILAVAGTASAAAGTSGNELVNYTQITNGSLSPTFGNANINGALNVLDAVSVGGLASFHYNIAAQSLTYNNVGLTVGWNFTDEGGEVDLLLGPQGGSGGLNIYQLNSTGNMVSTTPILALAQNGNLSVVGTASAAAGTSGNELVNYAQMTDGSITSRFSSIERNSSQESQNWLPNSTFLFGLAGWQAPPADMNTGTYAGTTYATYSGTDPSPQYLNSNPISAEWINSGGTCTLSGWVFNGTSSGDAYIQVACFTSSGAALDSVAVSSIPSGLAWTYVSATGAFPTGTAYVEVAMGFQGASSGSNIGFSRLKFELGSTATLWDDAASAQLFQNGQFSPEFDNIQINGSASLSGAVVAESSVQLNSNWANDTSGIVIGANPATAAGILLNAPAGYTKWLEQLMVDNTIMWHVDSSGDAVAAGEITASSANITGDQTIGGTLTVSGNAIAAAGTSGYQLVNYAQTAFLTEKSLSATTTAGNQTLTAAQMVGSYFADSSTQTAAYALTTDTAANLLGALPAAQVGTSFTLRVINNDQSSTGYAMTLAAGSGVTLSTALPNPSVGKGMWAEYLCTFTAIGASPAVTVVCVS